MKPSKKPHPLPSKKPHPLGDGIYLRVSAVDRKLLHSLAGRLPLKATTIARIALRIGLVAIDRDPTSIFTVGEK
jgi:hypothetical protein